LPADLADALAASASRLAPLGAPILFYSTIGSTNDAAAALAAGADAEGAVVIAAAQTAGRGRRGRTWFSPPVGGLYVSVVLAPSRAQQDPDRATALVTMTAGVALAEAIEGATGLAADIKWPNDLLAGGRKLAGILAEGISPGAGGVTAVVLGYGLNLGPIAYPPELRERATSLEAELGRPVDRAPLCAASLAALAARYRDLLAGRFDAILDAWRRRAPGSRGARVEWDSPAGRLSGITDGVDQRGALLVRTAAGLERIVAGEVVWR
jgi:BirA family biotin operon repressor/biotin-[acetyl-CoA-carboxylase] ligase